jgi:hypothetical protein
MPPTSLDLRDGLVVHSPSYVILSEAKDLHAA